MNLLDLITLAFKALEQELPADLDKALGTQGQQAADAVVKKVYLQQSGKYAGKPGDVGTDGKTNTQRLAQDGFLDFRHYLRTGNKVYPGAPSLPDVSDGGLGAGADFIYEDGNARTQIHNWCNTSAANLLANPPTTPPATH